MGPSNCRAFIAGLPEEVRAMVDSLPAHELEAFTHLASYSPSRQGKNKSSRGSKGKSREAHERYVGCDCWDCYTKFWEMWDGSPNKSVIDKALEALELKEGSARRYPWSKRRKGKEKASRSAPPPSNSAGKVKKEHSVGNLDEEAKPEGEVPPCSSASLAEPMRRVADKVKAESLSRPPRSKQVAPVDFKAEEEEAELLKPTPTSPPGDEESSPSRNGWKSASDAAGFVCDKLLWMWNPRLRRRQ